MGNPLNWSNADKGIVFFLFFVFANTLLAMQFEHWDTNKQSIPAYIQLFDFTYLFQIFATVFGWIILFVFVFLRKRDPNGFWFIYLFAPVWFIHDAFFMGWWGHSTNALTFALMVISPFLSYLFFNLILALIALGCWMVVLCGFLTLEFADIIPYAPGLRGSPVMQGGVDVFWVMINFSIGLLLVIMTLTLSGLLIHNWRNREAEVTRLSKVLKDLFGRYMTKEIVQELLENPDEHLSMGEKREITVMMTDLRGFTAISERLGAEEVVRMLNNYLGPMIEMCKKYRGTITDIIGDALLVTFGAPLKLEDHALAAVACAIEMQNAMEEVNAVNTADGLPEVAMGIGINTDAVVIGNIGSAERAKFTVIGSGVNTASRIESYTVGGQVLISESLKRMVGHQLRIDDSMKIVPKGLDEAIKIYEVGGVGHPYNVTLQHSDSTSNTLTRAIKVTFMVIDGKSSSGHSNQASFCSISLKGGMMSFEGRLEPLQNIKINLHDVSDDLARISFYGKILQRVDTGEGKYNVKFTAIPFEVNCFLQAAILLTQDKSDLVIENLEK
jgi:class 3 adenylate cyclase